MRATWPLGLARLTPSTVPPEQQPFTSVIGAVETTAAGNTVLRVGSLDPVTRDWQQTEHVVLTPAERDALVTALSQGASNFPGVA